MLQEFEKHIHKNGLFGRDDSLLVACSGGVDSMVLLDLLFRAGYKFSVAHVNFQLRGEESQKDEELVSKYCKEIKRQFFTTSFDTKTYSRENKVSIQMAARELRYGWFEELMDTHGFDYLLTAHHLDDSLETTLLNFIKGTGVKGLSGILAVSSSKVRPLLVFPKTTLLEYADERSLNWREDESNFTDDYQRNFIRHHLVPKMEEINPSLKSGYLDFKERITGYKLLIEERASVLKEKHLVKVSSGWELDLSSWQKTEYDDILFFEILSQFNLNSTEVSNLISCLDKPGSLIKNEAFNFYVDRNKVFINSKLHQNPEPEDKIINQSTKEAQLQNGVIVFEIIDGCKFDSTRTIADMDLGKLSFPLILRKWRQGDYFQPLGLKGRKKVSDYLIDQKVPVHKKENVMVLESQGVICWIVGMRMDDRFKVDQSTKRMFRAILKKVELNPMK